MYRVRSPSYVVRSLPTATSDCRCRASHHVTGSTVRPHIRACPTLRASSPRQVRPYACPFGRVTFSLATVPCGRVLHCGDSPGRNSLCASGACLDGGEHMTRSSPSRKGTDGVFSAPSVRLYVIGVLAYAFTLASSPHCFKGERPARLSSSAFMYAASKFKHDLT